MNRCVGCGDRLLANRASVPSQAAARRNRPSPPGVAASMHSPPNTRRQTWQSGTPSRRRPASCGAFGTGGYVLRPHSASQQGAVDMFRYGRTGDLYTRFQDYRGVMAIAAFYPVFCFLARSRPSCAVRRFLVHGHGTVRMPLQGLLMSGGARPRSWGRSVGR